MRRQRSVLRSAAASCLVAAACLALTSCRSPVASADESSREAATTEVGQGVHGWPLYERDVLRDGARTDVLWPLSSVRTMADGSVRRADILFAIGHWEGTDTMTRFGIRPLFDVTNEETAEGPVSDWDLLWPMVGWRDAPEGSRSHVFPVWWQGSGRNGEYQTAFPIWWSGHNDRAKWFHLVPFYGESEWTEGPRRPRAPSDDAAPAEDTRTLQYVLGPLFMHGTDTRDEREEWDLVWPLFHRGTWKGGEDSRAVVWWHRRDGDDTWSLLFPLWFHGKTAEAETNVVFPLYARHETAESDRRFYGGPLFMTYDRTDGTESSFDVAWPLFHRTDRTDGQTTRLFPFLWSESRGYGGYLHAWPLYGRDWDPNRTITSTIWPLFQYEDRADGSWELDAPLPFVHVERSERHDETRLFPLMDIESDADGSYSTRLALLFHAEGNAKGYRKTTLFPLFETAEHADGSYDGNAGLILATWDGDAKGGETFRVLWRLVQDDVIVAEEDGATHTKHLVAVNPLFRHESNDRGDVSWQALFGLVARTRKADEARWRLLWFIEI